MDFTKIMFHQLLFLSIAHRLILSFQKLFHAINFFKNLSTLFVIKWNLGRNRPQRVFSAQLDRCYIWSKNQLFAIRQVLLEALFLILPISLLCPVLIPLKSLNRILALYTRRAFVKIPCFC